MNNEIYLVIKEYNENLAKRQPWYSIKKLKEDLENKGNKVNVVSSLDEIPTGFKGKIIKTFSLNDIWNKKINNFNNLYFFITFPMYSFGKFLKMPKRILFENWKDLKRIFIFSLIPKFFVKKILSKAKYNIAISDRSYDYIKSLGIENLLIYYPFQTSNWGEFKNLEIIKNQQTIGYFGPPFTTRYFDEIVNLFLWMRDKKFNFLKKIITRIERDELKNIEEKYLSKLKGDENLKLISGFLTREELYRELKEIDLLILPFRIVMSELPIVVLEALELEIPVITTKDCGIHNLVKDINKIEIMEEFDKKHYDNVISFLNKSSKLCPVFPKILEKINKINHKTLEVICQK